jgi:hypothetical protein
MSAAERSAKLVGVEVGVDAGPGLLAARRVRRLLVSSSAVTARSAVVLLVAWGGGGGRRGEGVGEGGRGCV